MSEYLGYEPVYTRDGSSVTWNENANGFRLPTVEEWQYAAKGGQSYRYAGSDNLGSVGWYNGNSGKISHPVAQKKPNGYGLYDMSGNVCEWCWDSLGGNGHYTCGGSWYDLADHCEVDSKYSRDAVNPNYGLGFRVVRYSGK